MVTRETLTGADIPMLGRISTLPSILGWIKGGLVSVHEHFELLESRGLQASGPRG